MPSPRQQAAIDLEAFLLSHSEAFNAPYGILSGTEDLPRGGKVRVVTFGCARSLDAVLKIWAPTRITVSARGPASRDLDRMVFSSVDAVKQHLTSKFHL